ncbi:hypothetical protein CFOL_v3_03661 [Cephalotus follicularis]|uniref:Uncharacterized protein n=1 Tax=Cephalotus follicularis TaxID=3775 RepID=A0A1Q3AWP8_CEPFO|nr:hypothetical protein CFOL_v3_03661 [Cephalotus follicularis]
MQMVQQSIDSKFSTYGLGNTETNMPSCDKQLPVAMKKTVLRDVQNENRIMVPNSVGTSLCSKNRSPILDPINLSGIKRPSTECPASPPCHPSTCNYAANGHLVYVRRKSEAELGKSSTSDRTSDDADCPQSKQHGHMEDNIQPKSQIKGSKMPSFSAFAPFPMGSLMSSSAKSSVPPPGKPGTMFVQIESNAVPSLNNPKGVKNVIWEERYRQLQLLLKKLDQSDQEDYLRMLRSLSSVELSRHAVELEKRSIQLSLEEAKEVQRVAVLNVLGKSVKNVQAPLTPLSQSDK